MTKILAGIGIVVVLLIAAAIAAPFLIPVERYRGLIEAQVTKSTGREFHIDGPMKLTVLPRLKVELNDVRFGNAPGGEAAQMATIRRLDLGVALGPLLHKQIEAERLVLIEPRIALEIGRNGKPNWQFVKRAETAPDTTKGSGGRKVTFRFAGLTLKDGRLSYADLRGKTRYAIDKVNLDVDATDPDSPLSADGDLVYRGERIDVALNAHKPSALMQGGTTPLRLKLSSGPAKFSFDGQAKGGDALEVVGDLKADIPALDKLMRWAAPDRPASPPPVHAVSLVAHATANAKRAQLRNMVLKADALETRGDLGVDWSGARPRVTGTLSTGVLDLTAYLPAGDAKKAASGTGGGEQGWSDKPIDLKALGAADADLKLQAAGVRGRNFTTGPTSVTVALHDRKLAATVPSTPIFGGTADLRLHADAASARPAFGVEAHVRGVQAEPLLTAFAQFSRLQGTMNGGANLRASGASQRAIVNSLNGTANATFLDGAIKGINIASVLRKARTAYLDSGAGAAEKTDFAELSASFVLRNGTAHTDDLKMLAPLIRLKGQGDIIVPERRLAMRLEPTLVGSLKGQGGEAGLGGIAVPLIVEGPWNRPSFTPDVRGIATEVVKDRLLGGKGPLSGEGGLGGALDKLRGGKQPATGEQGGSGGALGGIRNLLGR